MKLKVGDKVRIKKWKKRPMHWNSHGEMDRWQGKEVTITEVGKFRGFGNKVSPRIKIKEDRNTHGVRDGWSWRPWDFEYIDEVDNMLGEDLFEI